MKNTDNINNNETRPKKINYEERRRAARAFMKEINIMSVKMQRRTRMGGKANAQRRRRTRTGGKGERAAAAAAAAAVRARTARSRYIYWRAQRVKVAR